MTGGHNQLCDRYDGQQPARVVTGHVRNLCDLFEPSDVMISKAVEDQGEDPAGDRHPGHLPSPSFGDAVEVGGVEMITAGPHRRFDRRPADQTGSLFGDPAFDDGRVRLPMTRGQTGPRRELFGSSEPVDVSNLGYEHRPQDLADPGNLTDRLIAGMTGQPPMDVPIEPVYLPVQNCDQAPERSRKASINC